MRTLVRAATIAFVATGLLAGCLSEPTEDDDAQAPATQTGSSGFPAEAWPAGYHLCTPGTAIEDELGMRSNPGPVETTAMFDEHPPDQTTGTILVRDGPEDCEANPHGVMILESQWDEAQDHQAFRKAFEAMMPETRDWIFCTQFQILHGDQETIMIQPIPLEGPTSDGGAQEADPSAMMYDLTRVSVAYENANPTLEPYCP